MRTWSVEHICTAVHTLVRTNRPENSEGIRLGSATCEDDVVSLALNQPRYARSCMFELLSLGTTLRMRRGWVTRDASSDIKICPFSWEDLPHVQGRRRSGTRAACDGDACVSSLADECATG